MSGAVNIGGLAGQLLFTHIFSFIPYTIVFYDYCLTLSDEVELFWLHPEKFNLFSYLFLFNRYVSLFGNLQILIFGIVGRIEFMIHAIYQSKRILVFLTSLCIAGFAFPCWSAYALSTHHMSHSSLPVAITPVLVCSRLVGETEGFYSAVSWTGGLVIDTTVFVLMLYKAFSIGRGIRILDTIMRNATVYYSILSLVNLSNILILRFAPPAIRTSTIALTNALSCTLISRIILDLRSKFGTNRGNQAYMYGEADERTELCTSSGNELSFAHSIFGNSVPPESTIQT